MENQALLTNLTETKPKVEEKKSNQDFVSSILDQDNDNVIDFFEQVDPMLAWALLKSKILPQVGSFDLLAEKIKLKNSEEGFLVVKSFLDELEILIQEVLKMLQNCCKLNEITSNSIPLSAALSMQLFGLQQASICVLNAEEFPQMYKEKLFKPQEMKPLHLVKAELPPTEDDKDDFNSEEFEDEEDEEDEDFKGKKALKMSKCFQMKVLNWFLKC